MSIKIYYDQTACKVKGWRKIARLIDEIIINAGKETGEINVIITNDENLRKINIQFLEHDYYTDVITFNYNDDKRINGEIYISSDTVRSNSHDYMTSVNNEMTRVIIHGVLHLTGHNDKSDEQRSEMRRLEDNWLGILEKK